MGSEQCELSQHILYVCKTDKYNLAKAKISLVIGMFINSIHLECYSNEDMHNQYIC